MKQKFRKLTFVDIGKKGTVQMFGDADCAIVEGTYSQLYGGDDVKSYSIYIVKGDKIINSCAWYDESELTEQENQDREKAEEMIERYNLEDE